MSEHPDEARLIYPFAYARARPFGRLMRLTEAGWRALPPTPRGSRVYLSRVTMGPGREPLLNEIGVEWSDGRLAAASLAFCNSWWDRSDASLYYRGVFLPKIVERSLYLALHSVAQTQQQLSKYQATLGASTQVTVVGDRWLVDLYLSQKGSRSELRGSVNWFQTGLLKLRGLIERAKGLRLERSTGFVSDVVFSNRPNTAAGSAILIVSVGRAYGWYRPIADQLAAKGANVLFWCNGNAEAVKELESSPEYTNVPIRQASPRDSKPSWGAVLEAANRSGAGRSDGDEGFASVLRMITPSVIPALGENVREAVDAALELLESHQPKVVMVGLTHYWFYSAVVQAAHGLGIPVVYLQDAFMLKGEPHRPDADHALVESEYARELFVENGFPPEATQVIGPIRFDPLRVGNGARTTAPYCAELTGASQERKFVVFATDPGSLVNTTAQKYHSELTAMQDVAGLTDVHLIVKLHPADVGDITRRALRESGAENITIVESCDLHRVMSECSIWISMYSTTVIESLIHGVYVLLTNYEGLDLFKDAVDYGAATFLNREGDLRDFLVTWASDGYPALLTGEAQSAYLEYQCFKLDGRSTERTVDALLKIAGVE
jgi:hypothetical protein